MKHVGGHQLVFTPCSLGCISKLAPLRPTAEVNLSPSSFHSLELKCRPTFSPGEIEIYGPLSVSTHASHYLKVPLFLGTDRYLL